MPLRRLFSTEARSINTCLLVFVLLTAGVLRFYKAFDIPFTHDELSALCRLRFDSFHELMEKGIKIDGHPAGVQVFLYYWTKWVGTTEFAIKLPFLLMGMGSIYFAYRLA